MRIDVSRLRQEKGREARFKLSIPPRETGIADEELSIKGPVRLDVSIRNTGTSLWVEVQVAAEVKVECGRCLEPTLCTVEAAYEEEYRRSEQVAGRLEDTDRVRAVRYEDDEIDLTEGVRQNLLLALPFRPLCRPDCRGLCPVCGQNLNQGSCNCDTHVPDPRLAKLADLLDREQN